jgi:hypothetical protein
VEIRGMTLTEFYQQISRRLRHQFSKIHSLMNPLTFETHRDRTPV